ncbi:MAG: iron-containing redox enzyme family protein [Methylibium sp.]|uniref:iron-containing redox enzyme family protein n=1 Tax=Methylibium sp. TaxID=2067992 RepID=UPI0017DE2F77|nr:iron-containing redox enzyme family protein [Methylibium sp.]MBA3597608.1 iron-containing redox enzyme family protein [Methylibium sp.]
MNAPDRHALSAMQAPLSPDVRHRRLAEGNRRRLLPGFPGGQWQSDLDDEFTLRLEEGRLVEDERRTVAEQVLQVPHEPDAFMHWFEALAENGPGQGDPLFPWLATQANLQQMRWFLTQEVAGEAGFDDLVALTQLRMPPQPKLELARNYWDEMGRGKRGGMHGPMLEMAVHELALEPSVEATVWESLALGNVMLALAANRRYAYHSVGALGVIELTAPGRVSQINVGLERLGISPQGRRYFQLHAGLDIVHSRDWNREVIRPLVESEPRCARAIAEGALMRLRCGARCFERYRAEFGLG